MRNRIEILQWREHGDDEDCLEVAVFGAGDEASAESFVASQDDAFSFGCEDIEKAIRVGLRPLYATNQHQIDDGQILTSHNGRTFRVSISEVTA